MTGLLVFFGWKTGFEPATPGTTIQCSNQLSYNHHVALLSKAGANIIFYLKSMQAFFEVLCENFLIFFHCCPVKIIVYPLRGIVLFSSCCSTTLYPLRGKFSAGD